MANHSTPLSNANVGLQARNRVQPATLPPQRRSVRFKTSVDTFPPARSAMPSTGVSSTDGKRKIPSFISPMSPAVYDPHTVIAALEARIHELELEKTKKVRIVPSFETSPQEVIAENFRLQQEVARLKSGEMSKEGSDSAAHPASHPVMPQSVRAPPDFEVLMTRWKNNYQELKARHEALLERETAKGRENCDLERKNMALSERVAQLELKLMWAKSSLQELTSAAQGTEQVVKQLQAQSRFTSGRMAQLSFHLAGDISSAGAPNASH